MLDILGGDVDDLGPQLARDRMEELADLRLGGRYAWKTKFEAAAADRDRLIARVQHLKQTWTHDASCWPPFGSGACAIKAIQKCLADLAAALTE